MQTLQSHSHLTIGLLGFLEIVSTLFEHNSKSPEATNIKVGANISLKRCLEGFNIAFPPPPVSFLFTVCEEFYIKVLLLSKNIFELHLKKMSTNN
jgi:hypothetical protein